MNKIKDKLILVIERIALDIKLLYNYVNERGLQDVTQIGNRTYDGIIIRDKTNLDKDIIVFHGGNDTGVEATYSAYNNGKPGVTSVSGDGLIISNGSNKTPSGYAQYAQGGFGLVNNNSNGANTFEFGSDYGYVFGYASNPNEPISSSNRFVKIRLGTHLHHSERYSSAGNIGADLKHQTLQFPPEDGTLATREWVLEGDSGTTPPIGNPTIGIGFTQVYRNYSLRDNFTIDHVNRTIDAVDTRNTTGANANNSKMFLVGVLSQTTGENGNQSYSNSKIYATNGTLTATAFNGNASTATKLATARTIRTNLGSTTAVSFDGSGNITPGVTGTLPIARGGTGTTSAGTAAQLTAGTTTTARVWSPKILADYVKEYVYEDKRVVNAIGSYGANNDHGATIILSTSTNGIGFGSASTLRDTFEVSLYNNSNGSKDIWGGDGFTYQLQDGTTSSTIQIKARGIGTITRITKGSTAIMLALGDFEV